MQYGIQIQKQEIFVINIHITLQEVHIMRLKLDILKYKQKNKSCCMLKLLLRQRAANKSNCLLKIPLFEKRFLVIMRKNFNTFSMSF